MNLLAVKWQPLAPPAFTLWIEAVAGPWLCGLQATKDRLTVKYKNEYPAHDDNYGTIQADYEVPRNRSVYYYEITIKNVGHKATITVGYADRSCKPTKQLGYAISSAMKACSCESPNCSAPSCCVKG